MKDKNSFTNSGLGRAKPRRRIFHSFINDKLKRHRSDTGLVEDRTSSTTIVRIIIGLLLLHLVIIGGVLLKGHFEKSTGATIASTLPPPPPSVAQPARQQDQLLPQPTAAATPHSTAAGANHITQAVVDEDTAEEIFPDDSAAAPVAATPAPTTAPATATPAPSQDSTPAAVIPAGATTVQHLVATGENWTSIARKYGTTVQALKAANPAAARNEFLYQGHYLAVPVKADSDAARAAAAANPPAAAPKTHTVKRGDTMGRIARKYKMPLPKLLKLNKMTEKDAGRISIGQQIIVSE